MPYTNAIFLADLPTMSDRGTNLPENYSNPQSSLQPPYTTFFPLLGNIHLSLSQLRIPSKFPRIPTRTKNTNPILLLTCSLPLSDFITFFSVFIVCLFSFYNFVQPLAITVLSMNDTIQYNTVY